KDGPSLGGFVCPATIVKAELWKVGQVKPGDKIRFKSLSFDEALAMELATDIAIDQLALPAANQQLLMAESEESFGSCILAQLPEKDSRPLVTYRQAGDKYILLEYGENILDLRLRLRVHALMEALKQSPING